MAYIGELFTGSIESYDGDEQEDAEEEARWETEENARYNDEEAAHKASWR